MNKHSDNEQQGTSTWQRGVSLACVLGAMLECIALNQRGPLQIELPALSDRMPGFILPLISLMTFALPALLLYFKADEHTEPYYVAFQRATFTGTWFMAWMYFKSLVTEGHHGALWVVFLTLGLRVLLWGGMVNRGYSGPTHIPDLTLGSSASAPSSYTLSRVVCSVCGTRYSGGPGTSCPGCTAPVENAVPLESSRLGSWWRLWEGPSRAQRQAATGLLLLNVLYLGAHVLLLREVSPLLIGLLVLDAALAALVWTRVGVGLVLARAVAGVLGAWMLFNPDLLPLLLLPQAVLGVSLGVLLLHRLGGWVRLLAAPGPLLYAVLVGVSVYSLATTSALASLGLLRLTHSLDPDPVALLKGRAEPYSLPLPPGPWYPYAREELDKVHADVALFNPSLGVEVSVRVQTLPKLADWPGLERAEAQLKGALEQVRPGAVWGPPHELPGPWDEARVRTLRLRSEGLTRESVMALYRRGDRLFILEAAAPAWRSRDLRPLIEELASALRYEPPSPAFLPEALAWRVKQATVRVRTPGGRGSGFIVGNQDGYLILTAQHALRSADGKQEPREARVLFSGDAAVERIATVRASDPGLDLALLQLPLDGPPLPALSLRVSPPAKDTPLVASDFPWDEPRQPDALRSWPVLQSGTVKDPLFPPSRLRPNTSASLILMEPALPRGHGGGPVVDLEGAVVGLALGELTWKAGVLSPPARLLSFVGGPNVHTLEKESPPAVNGAEPFSPPVREALSAALVSVSADYGNNSRVGVVLQVPGSDKGLVLTSAWGAGAGDTLEVGFFVPASQTWKARRGTVLATQPYQKNTLALVEVEAFPELPQGLPLQEPSRLSETDLVALGGLREVNASLRPLQRSAAVAGIDWASRWEHGLQVPARLRVALGAGDALKPGPAVDQEGHLVGFTLQHSAETNLVELVAAEPLRELIRGPVRAVAARASRDLKGDCRVEFFVDARGALSAPRTVSLAVAAPELSREEDSLVPVFGPERELGPLPEPGGRLRLPLPSCPGPTLVYRLQLTSALGAQRVEGRLPLPARALERTQARASLVPQEAMSLKLRDFMEWKDEEAAPGPATPEEAVAACASSPSACGFVTALGAAATARERTRLLQPLQAACRKGQAPACLGWAEMAELPAPPPPPGKAGPPGARAGGQGGAPGQETLLPEVRTALGLGCDAGLAEACSRLGQRLMRHGHQDKTPGAGLEDWKQAAELLRKGCEAGSAEGCSGLAGSLVKGYGVPQDETLALRRYSQACRLQDAGACLSVGYLGRGRSSPAGSRERLYEAFREACLLGLAEGCTELARVVDQAR